MMTVMIRGTTTTMASKREKLIPRYLVRFDKEYKQGWEVWDRIRGAPVLAGGSKGDIQKAARLMNAGKKPLPKNYKLPIRISLIERERQLKVIRKELLGLDKFELTKKLSDYLSYATDRMGEYRIFYIQALWEAVQLANGFRPISKTDFEDIYDYARGM
jgi:hypothetical protein